MSGGKSDEVTVGYKYHLDMHLILCQGHIDHVHCIRADGREAWKGEVVDGPINIDATRLFGGEEREGGISGTVDVESGLPGQQQNAFLKNAQAGGGDIPAYRGVSALVLQQCYMGNNPYLKPWSACVQRIHKRSGGIEQWYNEKAAIGDPLLVADYKNLLKWIAPGGGGSGDWSVSSNFSSDAVNKHLGYSWAGFHSEAGFGIPIGTAAVYAGTATLPPLYRGVYIHVEFYHDDSGTAYSINGGGEIEIPKDDYYHSHTIMGPVQTIDISYTVLQGVPSGSTSDFGGGIALTPMDPRTVSGGESASKCRDMNPAHIIRECLTDPLWGMGYNSADIDDDAFMAVADTLWDEAFGLSFHWKKEESIADFVGEVLRHIDATLYVDRKTGKFVLKLIRNDYSEPSLIVLDEAVNVSSVDDARRPTISELTTSVTVNYRDRDTRQEGSVTEHNQALIQLQGGVAHTTIAYPGVRNNELAKRITQRDLRVLSTPLLKCHVQANRDAASLNIGDPFVLNAPTKGIYSLVCRVEQITFGDGKSNTISIRCVEDAFGLPDIAQAGVGQDGLWKDPLSAVPEPAEPRLVTEAPYYRAVTMLGESAVNDALALEESAGYLMVAAGRQGGEFNALMNVDSGAGYANRGTLDFSPHAVLSADAWFSDSRIYIDGGADLDLIVIGKPAQIGDEIIRVDAVGEDSNGAYIDIGRGCLDTVPDQHSAGDAVLFWGFSTSTDGVQYVESDHVSVKLRTVIGPNTLSPFDAPEDSYTFNSRAIRPYPPADLKINSQSYPENIDYTGNHTLTWAHRDRLQQTGSEILDHFDGPVGPEAGTTYLVRMDAQYLTGNFSGTLFEESLGNVTSYSYSEPALDSSFSGIPPSATAVRLRVFSVRDGYESWQGAAAILSYEPTSNDGDDMILLDSITNVSVGEFDFTGIPGGYSRLIIKGAIRSNVGAVSDTARIYFNGDTTNENYYRQHCYAGNGAGNFTESNLTSMAIVSASSAPASAHGMINVTIEEYSNTSLIKGSICTFSALLGSAEIAGGCILSFHDNMTAAINRIQVRSTSHPTNGLTGTLKLYGEL